MWEITFSRGAESTTDHAAKWVTSNRRFFYPNLADLAALSQGSLAPVMIHVSGVLAHRHGKLELNLVRSELKPLLELKGEPEALEGLEWKIRTVERR